MSKTTLRAQAPLRGDLQITVRRVSDGHLLRTLHIKNKILVGGYAALVGLLDTQDYAGNRRLDRIRVGTGSAPPALGDNDVSTPITASGMAYPWGKVDFAVTRTQFIDPTAPTFELRCSATVPGGSDADPFNAANTVITEAGLLLVNGTLFSRQIHPGITKTSAIAIDYEWHVRFIPA